MYFQESGTEHCHQQERTDNSWGPRAIGDHGALCPCPNSKKPMKKVPGASMGPPTDPGPLGSARVSKWSVRPWPEQGYSCHDNQ
ncbi:unnamed protein product, partial [Staurois parvus]